MAGQYPGTFGPPPGAAAQPPGRPSTSVRVLCALVPLLTVGMFGPLPSLVLAIRRRRPYDIAGAAVYCLLLLTVIVCAGVADDTKGSAAMTIGEIAIGLLWLTPTLHFIVMDRRSLWAPAPYAPYASLPTVPYAPPPAVRHAPPPAAPYGATAPGHTTPPPADDLRELGELLRRQAREGRS